MLGSFPPLTCSALGCGKAASARGALLAPPGENARAIEKRKAPLNEKALRTIYLGLGSNVGDRAANLEGAIRALGDSGLRVLRRSSFYQTEPMDFPAQHWFLNCVVEAETRLLPLQLLRALRRIEARLGGRKLVPRGPRRIDLDILLYGNATIRMRELEVPHPRMSERRFVLAPLAKIAPAMGHPRWGKKVAELLAAADVS